MDFVFWFAPAFAFVFCTVRSSLGRAVGMRARAAGSIVPAAIRSLFGYNPAGHPALRGG